MQQITLAQTEEYSNSNSYITSGCGDSINSALFADSDVITFYKRQGWTLEPKGNKCAFWYSN